MVLKPLIFILLLGGSAEALETARTVSMRTGYARLSSSLTGTGFTAELPTRSSLNFGMDATFQSFEKDLGFEFRFERTDVSLTGPSSLTPTEISAHRQDMMFLLTTDPWTVSHAQVRFRPKFGFALTSTGATATMPNEIQTSWNTKSVVAGAIHEWSKNSELMLRSEFLFVLPFSLNESDQVTGHSPTMIGFDARTAANYKFSETLEGYAGIGYRYDRVAFSGEGPRGVNGGTDVRALFSIPVGVRYGF